MGKASKPRAFYPLKEVIQAIDRRQIVFLFNREKNKNTLKKLGLTIPEAVKHIRSLRDSQFEETSILPGQPKADVYKKNNKQDTCLYQVLS